MAATSRTKAVDPGAVDVVPATADRWDDLTTVFGTRGDPARCWCQWFRVRNSGWQVGTPSTNREALRAEVASAGPRQPPPGVIAYVDGEPRGWCAIGPRTGYPRLLASTRVGPRVLEGDDLDDESVWSVTCFVVPVGQRRQGLGHVLLDGAVSMARDHGATVVEAYPVDVSEKGSTSSANLYHGTLSMFVEAGFREVARPAAARPLVRLALADEQA
jgi:hypothetical protein